MIGEVRWGEDTNTVLAMIFSQLNTILCWWRSWPVRLSVFAYSLSSHSFTSIETSWMWKNTLREGGREEEEESEVQILPQHQPSPASRHTQWKLRICRQLCLSVISLNLCQNSAQLLYFPHKLKSNRDEGKSYDESRPVWQSDWLLLQHSLLI